MSSEYDLVPDEPLKRPEQPAPLPRLWKTETDGEEPESVRAAPSGNVAPRPQSQARTKVEPGTAPGPAQAAVPRAISSGASKPVDAKRKETKSADAIEHRDHQRGRKGETDGSSVLLEATPALDTHETRQRVRIALGVGSIVVLGFVIFFLLSSLGGDEPIPDDQPFDDPAVLASSSATPKADKSRQNEIEASAAFEVARENAKGGKLDLAIAQLKKIEKNYPETKVAAEATAALARPSQRLPLFVDGPALALKPAEPPLDPAAVATPEEPRVVVDLEVAVPPGASKGEVVVALPPNPAEPRRELGMPVVVDAGGTIAAPGATGPGAPAAPSQTPTRSIPQGFKARTEAGVHPTGWPMEIVGERDGATLVFVPGGEFLMGRDDGSAAERPAHKVTLPPYYLDQHEVTLRQYRLYLTEATRRGDRPHQLSKEIEKLCPSEEHPIVLVTAREALAFAQWAGKRLPSEAQWEFAARTPDGRLHPWGPGPAQWDRARAWKQLDRVMEHPRDLSPYGVFDLAGNAWEWTGDWFDAKYYQQFRETAAYNPPGPVSSKTRPPQVAIKGSSKDFDASWREGVRIDARMNTLGFRCVLNLPTTGVEGGNRTGAAPGAVPGSDAGAGGRGSGQPVPF